jgi:hypothetical protein
MTGARRLLALLALAATPLALGGGSCGGRASIDLSGGGGNPDLGIECAPLPGAFPAGLDFIPGQPARVVVANFVPSALLPFDADPVPPSIPGSTSIPTLPPDSDGDGRAEGSPLLPLAPSLDGVLGVAPGLAFATASGYEEVLFVNADSGSLRSFTVATPASLAASDYPLLPPPGTSAARTAVSTLACVAFPAGALDSRGDPVQTSPLCPDGELLTTFTSGAALAAGHLFVSTSNLGDDPGTANTQFLPGSVLVYDVDLLAVPPQVAPNPLVRAIFTSAFNPTDAAPVVTPGGRGFVLVTDSGAIGLRTDDPQTPAIEGGGIALSDAAIDVIDPAALQLVARVPLGRAGLSSDRLALDPGHRVAFTGSATGRHLYAIDLAALDAIPPLAPVDPPVQLDGSDSRSGFRDARIFDASHPFVIDALPNGAPPESCDGFVVAAAFDHSGKRLYATEFCDGSMAVVDVDLSGSPTIPVPADRFALLRVRAVTAPVGPAGLGEMRAPGPLAVRPGAPGVDFDGPDLFFLVGDPEGSLCVMESSRL